MTQPAPITQADCPPPDPNPHAPRFAMPANATDCHAHLFGPEARYPWSPGRGYTPPDASYEDYTRLHQTLGVARGVLTQPSVYGTDNTLMLDAMRAHPDRLRGVVAIDDSATDNDLAEMTRAGVRGMRINLVDKGGMPFDSVADIHRIATRIKEHGWHIEFLVHVHSFPDLRATLGALPVDVSIGHVGYMPPARGVNDPGFQDFLALVKDGKCWVKLTGPYRFTALRQTPYTDVTPLARAVVAANPDRCVWGTDWPHPHVKIPMPNDGDLLDALEDWVPDPVTRKRILVDNSARLYGFPA